MLFAMSAGDAVLFRPFLRHGSLNPAITGFDFLRFLFAFYCGV
jgi:hypothetical protein